MMLSITLAGAGSAEATLIVQDFEGIPDQYLYFGGNQNLNGYLPGLNFSPQVTVLDRVRYGYNDTGYPPHSGDAVIFSDPEDYMRIDFLGFTSPYVEMWYTCGTGFQFYVEGYNAAGQLVDSAAGSGNYGSNALISISGAGIAYVMVHDTGNLFTIDDLGYIPEPAALSLLALGGLAVLKRRRS